MNFEERCDLVLAFARVLFVNGQSTQQTLDAAGRVGDIVGLHGKIFARWGSCNSRPRLGMLGFSPPWRPILSV
ncbi:hypothetical protein [Tunturiibacter gelidiferens]|uniref:hypothetical protein n=1 Tax=Tunturiibacter gelidiferens TaxID=3069689 RepID=UPI003D9B818C